MAMDMSQLIRAGFSRRQSSILSSLEGGGPSDILELKTDAGATQHLSWQGSSAPWQSFGDFVNFNEVGLQAGTAITYDPDQGITYTADGVYLNYLFVRFIPGQGYVTPAPGTSDNVRATLYDNQYLTFVERSNAGLDYFQTTWMALQAAGDTNVTPMIDFFGDNPYAIATTRYVSVRLLA